MFHEGFTLQINKEREGEQIDRSLVKNVLSIFVAMGIESYEADFEDSMLEDTAQYYQRKAALWIMEDRCPDYILKAST